MSALMRSLSVVTPLFCPLFRGMTSLQYVVVSTLLLIMNNETFELFFSMLSVALLAGTLVVLVARVLYTRSTSARSIVSAFAPWALPLAAAVTSTCALGSLYFSEIVNYKPCIMCWYQRTMMYPLAVILIVAAFTKDSRVWRYATPLATIGITVSTYHWFLERFPNLDAEYAMLKCHASLCGLKTSVLLPCHLWHSQDFLQYLYSPPFQTHKRSSHE